MLAGLFEEEDKSVVSGNDGRHVDIPSPPRPRLQCGFAGISNQGATCYLNSLLQTLLFTPEFRGKKPTDNYGTIFFILKYCKNVMEC